MVQVRVRLAVRRLVDVDVVKQNFKAQLQLEASWVDEKLNDIDVTAHPPVDENGTVQKLQAAGVMQLQGLDQKFFAPRLSFQNLVSEPEESAMWYSISKNKRREKTQGEAWRDDGRGGNAIVSLRWKLCGTFHIVMDMTLFPIDVQTLSMVLVTGWERLDKRAATSSAHVGVLLVKNVNGAFPIRCHVEHSTVTNEYELSEKIRFTQEFTDARDSTSRVIYSTLAMAMCIRRRSRYWVYQVVR
jgi:hypothetical protein